MQALQSPFPFIAGLDGKALSGGKLFLGVENDNPETAPVTVFWDEAGTQPAAQPVDVYNGYPSRNGSTPAVLYFAAPVSLTIRDQRGRLVIYAPSTRDLTVGFVNPMTTPGDLIRGGTAGAAVRLPVGADGQVLSVQSGLPTWLSPTVGFANPMTAAGDLIIGGALGVAQRLGIGAAATVLTSVAGAPVWQAPAAAYAPPSRLSFSARRTSTQGAAGGIVFADTSFSGGHNDSSFLDVGTGVATVPAARGGDYLVLFGGHATVSAAGAGMAVELRVNGTQVHSRGFQGNDLGATSSVAITTILALNAGDTVSVNIASISNAVLQANSNFAMRRISLT